MTKTVKYSELKIGDVIIWYGAEVVIRDINRIYREPNGHFKGGNCTYFTIAPNNEKALEILGGFYAHGTYGGIDTLEVAKVIA